VTNPKYSNLGTHAQTKPVFWCLLELQNLYAYLSHKKWCGRGDGACCTIYLVGSWAVKEDMLFILNKAPDASRADFEPARDFCGVFARVFDIQVVTGESEFRDERRKM